jgi:muramidase (phage lysozyme)
MTVAYKQSDLATDHLLDFIAGGVPDNPSGESAGCYDATFGDIDGSTYGDLSKKTVSQVYAMQDQMLNNNGISTATGRYQALKSTLQEYVSRNGLPSSTMFTEKLQDDFGLTKMIDRGYQSWWNGAINDDEFMNRLSCEWASLPDPYNGGRSHYEGDSAGNSASTSLAAFQSALDQARDFIEDGGRRQRPEPPEPEPPLVGAIDDPVRGVKMIQRTLVLTGDLDGRDDVDGIFGSRSQAALDNLVERSQH